MKTHMKTWGICNSCKDKETQSICEPCLSCTSYPTGWRDKDGKQATPPATKDPNDKNEELRKFFEVIQRDYTPTVRSVLGAVRLQARSITSELQNEIKQMGGEALTSDKPGTAEQWARILLLLRNTVAKLLSLDALVYDLMWTPKSIEAPVGSPGERVSTLHGKAVSAIRSVISQLQAVNGLIVGADTVAADAVDLRGKEEEKPIDVLDGTRVRGHRRSGVMLDDDQECYGPCCRITIETRDAAGKVDRQTYDVTHAKIAEERHATPLYDDCGQRCVGHSIEPTTLIITATTKAARGFVPVDTVK